jgi:hypothetical protein
MISYENIFNIDLGKNVPWYKNKRTFYVYCLLIFCLVSITVGAVFGLPYLTPLNTTCEKSNEDEDCFFE